MASKYVRVPRAVSIGEIERSDYRLSPAQYKDLAIENDNFKWVRDFLDQPLRRSDLGVEVDSLNYVERSPYLFLRAKALQSHSYLPEITEQSGLPVRPSAFVQMNLKEGDLLVSKDGNVGEMVILDKDYLNAMLSGAIYRLPVSDRKYYLLACVKHDIFREQLNFMVPKGAVIRHTKTRFLDCEIPVPKTDTRNTIAYVELLTQAVINKEKRIQKRHGTILESIERELAENQKPNAFEFDYPTIGEMEETNRLDTSLYRREFKIVDFKIKNYKGGFSTFEELGFILSRGQNLQVSSIGQGIYAEQSHKGFYTLMLPKHLSKYGTVDKKEYLGNSKGLKVLETGDLVFGAEGSGRSIVIIEKSEKTTTNIHGITIKTVNSNLTTSIFVKCFLDYLRDQKMIDLFAVGGHGGSLAQKYWNYIPFPNFPETKQREIAKLFHNSEADYRVDHCTLDNFLEADKAFNEAAGIYELDETMKVIKACLHRVIDAIANDKRVELSFDFKG